MQPIDKFGNRIFPSIYNRLLSIGTKLKSIGFEESRSKPNLFYRKDQQAIIFADMRGTNEVKIWKDPIPLVYMKFDGNIPLWQKNRIRNKIEKLLKVNMIKFRNSFYESIEDSIDSTYYLQDQHLQIFKSEALFKEFTYGGDESSYGPMPSKVDGYCVICKEEIQRDTLFCDRCFKVECNKREAKKVYEQYKIAMSKLKKCNLCGRSIYLTKTLKQKPTDFEFNKWLFRYQPLKGAVHHIEYQPEEKVIEVCSGCHNDIHHTNKYPELKPKPGESRKFYNRKRRLPDSG